MHLDKTTDTTRVETPPRTIRSEAVKPVNKMNQAPANASGHPRLFVPGQYQPSGTSFVEPPAQPAADSRSSRNSSKNAQPGSTSPPPAQSSSSVPQSEVDLLMRASQRHTRRLNDQINELQFENALLREQLELYQSTRQPNQPTASGNPTNTPNPVPPKPSHNKKIFNLRVFQAEIGCDCYDKVEGHNTLLWALQMWAKRTNQIPTSLQLLCENKRVDLRERLDQWTGTWTFEAKVIGT